MKEELFALLYASFNDSGEIYVTSFGSFKTEEEARREMEKYIEIDIKDGYDKVDWDVTSDSAVYEDDKGFIYKTYRVQRIPKCK